MSLLIFNTRKGYALSQPGFIVASKIKLDSPALPVTLVGLVSYSFQSQDTTITVFSPFHDPLNVKVNLSGQIIALGAGFEYGIFSRSQIKPYVGSDAALSILSGKAENLPYGISSNVKVKSALRFGVGVGSGCQVDFPSWPFAVEVEAKYRLANLLGKQYHTPVFVSHSARHLNDGKDPNDPTDGTRSINYISVYAGLVF